MGAVGSLVNIVLLLLFLVETVVAPLIYGQTCLPITSFPEVVVDLKQRYVAELGDYLMSEKPQFFIGVVWLKLLFQWPLALVSLYALSARKSWFNTACLIYGVSSLSSRVIILGEVFGSGRASDKMLMVYYAFTGLSILAILRGLVPPMGRGTTIGKKRPVGGRRKKA